MGSEEGSNVGAVEGVGVLVITTLPTVTVTAEALDTTPLVATRDAMAVDVTVAREESELTVVALADDVTYTCT